MRYRSPLIQITGLILLLLVGGSFSVLRAQDRGAPRFGPAVPGDTLAVEEIPHGRLWSLAAPPLDRFKRLYGMNADSAWVAHLRRGLLRLPHCTAALVSGKGLAITSARCARRYLNHSVEGAFVARTSAEERPLSSLAARRLLSAKNVTTAVRAAKRDTAVQRAVQFVQNHLQSEVGRRQSVEVIPAAGGAHYMAYTYRKYEDVRLVFLPNSALSAFGGIEAALTYPSYALDVALLRIYEGDGTPVTPTHYFKTPTQSRRPGDPVFAAGFTSETRRAESVQQLAYRRDVVLPAQESTLETWTQAVKGYLDTAGTSSGHWASALTRGRRRLKQNRARQEALGTEYVITQLQERDSELRRFLRADSSAARPVSGILDSLAAIQSAKQELAPAYRAFGPVDPGPYHSSTFRRALLAYQASHAEGRRREQLLRRLANVPAQPVAIDIEMLRARLTALREYLRPDTSAVRRLLKGVSPEERATTIVTSSALAKKEFPRDRPLDEAELPSTDDPALLFIDAFAAEYRDFREEFVALNHAERKLTRQLARARSEIRSTPVLPAADGAPRLTDGRLRGYPYNGTVAPPFTTFYGLFGRAHAFTGDEEWALPEEWQNLSSAFDRSTPVNISAAIDGVAAPPGAPIFNQYLEIVGVTTGPNIQGTAGEYIYLPRRMRTVAVDLRGLRAALSVVHEAKSLVDELFGASVSSGGRSR